jgi:hypothetical protein
MIENRGSRIENLSAILHLPSSILDDGGVVISTKGGPMSENGFFKNRGVNV